MPTSTAATITQASSPAPAPATETGIVSGSQRPGLCRRIERHVELAFARIDRQPFDADGAHRHAALLRRAGPVERRRHIGARAPVGADGDIERRAAFGHISRLGVEQPVGADRHQHLAGKARRDLQMRHVAGLVAVLVERDLQPVRRLRRGRLDEPAGIEIDAGGRPGRIVGLDFELIAAPVDRHGDLEVRCRPWRRSCRRRPSWCRLRARSSRHRRCGTTDSCG